MQEVHLRAFQPIPFPQVRPGFVFNANFCRNPMCPNFGPAPDMDTYAARYKFDGWKFKGGPRFYKCKFCWGRWRLLSNRSLRAAYVWFKTQSIPFAACPKEDCENYGVNAFEYRGSYWQNTGKKNVHRLRCPKCRSGVELGEAFNMEDKEDERERAIMNRRMVKIFKHVRVGLGMRNSMVLLEDPDVHDSLYLNMLSVLGRQIRDYHSYCNASMMAPDYLKRLQDLFMQANGGDELPGPKDSPFNGTATLSFDTLSVSLRTPTSFYRHRQHLLPVAMTAMRIHKPETWFVLAAHPCAAFEQKYTPVRDDKKRMLFEDRDDAELPLEQRRFDHLYHAYTAHGRLDRNDGEERENQRKTKGKGPRGRTREMSYLGAGGYLMVSEYAAMAHFMVVRDLTRRFRQVTLCMDGGPHAFKSAAAVFACDMRNPPGPLAWDTPPVEAAAPSCSDAPHSRRVEIAILQTERVKNNDRKEDLARTPDKDRLWNAEKVRIANDWESRIRTEMEAAGLDRWAANPVDLAKAKAKLFRRTMRGARPSEGRWSRFHFVSRVNVRAMLLWLSQGPDRDWPPEGDVDSFLRYADLQSVDSAMQVMRRRAPAARRPRFRADSNPSYTEASENLRAAMCGIWLAWFCMNYHRPWSPLERLPARLLGLMHKQDMRNGFNIAPRLRLRLRLGRKEATEMTERIGRK